MATGASQMKDADIFDVKQDAGVFYMSGRDPVKNAVRESVAELKRDSFYRLSANVEEASAEETDEILAEIEGLSDDDLSIASTKRYLV